MSDRTILMNQILRERFPGCDVEVIDLTGTNDHIEVRIRAQELNGLSRVQQHQAIMKCFAGDLKTGDLHALAIKVLN